MCRAEPHEGPCPAHGLPQELLLSSFSTPKIQPWFIPGTVSQAQWGKCLSSHSFALCWQQRQGTTAASDGAEAQFYRKIPQFRVSASTKQSRWHLQQGGQFDFPALPAGQVLRRVVAGAVLPPQQGCPSPLPAQREKTAARTQLPMTPKITACPSALPRNRIWNHSILAKLEFV